VSGEPKILLTTLWQCTSERGNEYLSGFLGKARIVGFRGEPREDGTPTWNIYLTPGREQEEGRGTAPSRTSSPSAPNNGGSGGHSRHRNGRPRPS
jgi:hypothetical protein